MSHGAGTRLAKIEEQLRRAEAVSQAGATPIEVVHTTDTIATNPAHLRATSTQETEIQRFCHRTEEEGDIMAEVTYCPCVVCFPVD